MRDVNAIGCQALLGFRIFPAQFRRSECARGTAKDIRAVTAAPRETGFPLVLYIERQRCVNQQLQGNLSRKGFVLRRGSIGNVPS
jgi:hypothetical protein